MSGKVFISGGGNAPDSFLIDQKFVDTLSGGKLLYLPIGLKRTISGYFGCYDWLLETLGAHTDKPLNVEMWVDLKNKEFENIQGFDAVYIGGANNTYRLLDTLHKNNVDKLLQNYVAESGTIYGGSSGGIILGKNISLCKDNRQDYKYIDGLDLLSGFSVFCHYGLDVSDRELILDFIEANNSPVLCLPETSGAVYYQGKITVYGFSDIEVLFSKSKSIILQPNDEIMLE